MVKSRSCESKQFVCSCVKYLTCGLYISECNPLVVVGETAMSSVLCTVSRPNTSMAAHLHEVAGTRYVKQVPTNKRLVSQHLISHPDDTEKFSLRASIVLTTGEFLFLDKANKHIKLVDTHFKCVSVMQFNTCPFDICASNKRKSEFYVTEPEEQSIHCIMAGQGSLTKYKSWSIFEDCRGITCWKSGIALTVM